MREKHDSGRHYILALVVYVLLSTLCFATLRSTLMENADDLAGSLANSYAYEMESNNRTYETLLSFTVESIDERIADGWDEQLLQLYAMRIFSEINKTLGADRVEAYMIYHGQYVSQDGVQDDDSTDYTARPWYNTSQSLTYSPVYEDIFTGGRVITLKRASSRGDIIIALDIHLDQLDFTTSIDNLPEQASLYLIDSEGNLILFESNWAGTYSDEEVQSYIGHMEQVIASGGKVISGIDGQRRSLHYSLLDNGWTAVITIPYSVIFAGLNRLYVIFSIVFAAGLTVVTLYIIRERKYKKEADSKNETIRIISNMYYALYRVNYISSSYEMIKGSAEMAERIPRFGSYDSFLETLDEFIEQSSAADFKQTFSAQGLKKLVEEKKKDFGGDIMRRFGSEYKPVSVRMIYDESLASGEVILAFREVEAEREEEMRKRLLLSDALAAAKQSEKAKQAFFSSMSHDMRTPLNAIIGLTELARKKTDEKDMSSYLERISSSSRQLLQLVNDILEMSRLEMGSLILDNARLDLIDTVEECASAFTHIAQQDGKKFTTQYDVQDRIVMADAFRLTQIMNNILSNAFKYTENGKGEIRLSVRQYKNSSPVSQYAITIEDNGMGMSQDFLKHLFEPYARETRFYSHQISGTGLGMPIVRSLVTQMSGQIKVESTLGKGSVFTVTIPLETAEPDSSEAAAKAEPAVQKEEYSLKGKRILLAEDNLINMEIATELLESEGASVTQAWNGKEAVDIYTASAERFDAVLLDMKMPVMDGCEAARALRASSLSDAADIPIIAVTANAFAEDIALTRSSGMDAHISKPIDFAVLTKTLSELTEKGRNTNA